MQDLPLSNSSIIKRFFCVKCQEALCSFTRNLISNGNKSMQRVNANAGREGDAGCRKQQWAVKLRCWAACQAHLTWKQQLPLNSSPTSPKPGESQSPQLTSERVPKHKQYFYSKIPVQAHNTSSHARKKPAAVYSRFVHCFSETTTGTKEPLLETSEAGYITMSILPGRGGK